MTDFTLDAYHSYLEILKSSYDTILRFDEYFLADPKPNRFCLIRHDVDRHPHRALRMARLESEYAICSTYYFRTRPHVFLADVIGEIAGLGHEIGYHYECFADAKGDLDAAFTDFSHNLNRLREITAIRTIAMHGSPLSRFDNRDMWRADDRRKTLETKHELLGEVYLDVDYTDILYINDTGRNWSSDRSNRRDKVASRLSANFRNGRELIDFIESTPPARMVFQVHPERWSRGIGEYLLQWNWDLTANMIKRFVRV